MNKLRVVGNFTNIHDMDTKNTETHNNKVDKQNALSTQRSSERQRKRLNHKVNRDRI